MCGIAGFVGKPDKNTIQKMTRTLIHRGPDDEGYFVNEQAALGMRRLRIIDLAGGKQPMLSPDGKIVVVFNGEIYNFKQLRGELEKAGERFRTNSDTEAIVLGYKKWGTGVFQRLDGMFGVAVWDAVKNQLVLARDRFGEKPLYYGKFDGIFIFGSELKAILLHPAARRELNTEALARYLTFDYVPAPLSIFKNIFKLEPGTFLIYPESILTSPSYQGGEGGGRVAAFAKTELEIEKGGKWQIQRYWNINFTEKHVSFPEAEQLLEQKLERAVTSRLVSDVRLGIFLSGGLDSSTIAYFAQKNSTQKIKTFSIGFEDKSFDESGYARTVAEFLHTEHTDHVFSPADMQAVIPEIFSLLDEPFSDPSFLPTYLLAKSTREKVTVALEGDGSDELFGGYPTFQARKFLPFYNLLPKKLINPLINLLPTSFDNITAEYGLKRIALSSRYPDLHRDFVWINSFAPHEQESLFAPVLQAPAKIPEIFSNLQEYLSEVPGASKLNKIIYLYLKLYLQDNILTKSDRASMMVSLETRAPFLALELSEFINTLPIRFKMSGLTTKYLLKRVMKKYLPPEIVFRKKKGFGIPMARWLTGDLKPLMLRLLDRDRIEKEGFFAWPAVEKLIAEHLSKKKDNRKTLWTLIVFELWLEKWLR
jgi:asparagine synthase (glutamine-hydrolysing)